MFSMSLYIIIVSYFHSSSLLSSSAHLPLILADSSLTGRYDVVVVEVAVVVDEDVALLDCCRLVPIKVDVLGELLFIVDLFD